MANGKITQRKLKQLTTSWQDIKSGMSDAIDEVATMFYVMFLGIGVLYIIAKFFVPLIGFLWDLGNLLLNGGK